MKSTINFFVEIGCIAFLFFTSCRKERNNNFTCTSTLYGYTAPLSSELSGMRPYVCSAGTLNPITGGFSPVGSFSGDAYAFGPAAYSSSDHSYYVFGSTDSLIGGVFNPRSYLYKINPSGSTTALAAVAGNSYCTSLTFSRATNKLYCCKGGSVAVLSIGTSSYSVTNVVSPVHYLNGASLTVNDATGDLYYVTTEDSIYSGTGETFYVEKYHPGAPAATVVATDTTFILGLMFNNSNNLLYGISGIDNRRFIEINPLTGSITRFSTIEFQPQDFTSLALDPCSNRYIVSTVIPLSNSFILYQMDMSGSLVRSDTTGSAFYQGLTVAY